MRESILASLELESEEIKSLNVLDLFWDPSNLRVGRRLRIAFLILSVQQMMDSGCCDEHNLCPRFPLPALNY
ncbi:hypothetical protein N7447_006214 [Penicillium robsamsonii]|uniref:uncharacterized protein n=1 Tax=Penicillium robsamsonii TaxID=1792511 RepID=UPI0025494175|nr:uncharacterized protein N7447_006214 [Penicillium robsamsonii]KAJ5823874.1 hypothetical protein N7447_006214 [Penicillium robsamsonii]